MKKQTLTQEQVYKKRQKRAKLFSVIAPVCFWTLLLLALILFYFSLKNSIGNIAEIIDLLDNKIYNGEQLAENYAYLVNKYGEWVIGSASGGFTITFINIKRAVFNGLAVIELITSITCFISAYLWGRWLLPLFAKSLTQNNQDMVNLTILKNFKE